MLIDNNQDFVTVTAQLLILYGYQVSVYYDGPSALDAIADKNPDIILLDLAMPVMNGYEVCVRLRSEAWGKHVPVIALTGYGQEQDVARALNCGFSGFILKPAYVEQYLEAITKSLFYK